MDPLAMASTLDAPLRYLTLHPIPISALPSTSALTNGDGGTTATTTATTTMTTEGLQNHSNSSRRGRFLDELQREARYILEHPKWHTPKSWHKGLVTTSSLPLHAVRFEPAHADTDTQGNPIHHEADPASAKKKGNGTGGGWFGRSNKSKEKDLNEEGIAWHKRTTVRPVNEYPYEVYHEALGTSEHIRNEVHYISSLCRVEPIGNREDAFIKLYELPFGTTNRSFLVAVVLIDTTPAPNDSGTTPLRSFLIVSLPIADGSSETASIDKGYVRGRYVAVEQLKEVESKNGEIEIEWSCASMSDPGGSIPVRLAEAATASAMANAVPSFYDWLAQRAPPPPKSSSEHDQPHNSKRFSMSSLKRTLSHTRSGPDPPVRQHGGAEEVKASA